MNELLGLVGLAIWMGCIYYGACVAEQRWRRGGLGAWVGAALGPLGLIILLLAPRSAEDEGRWQAQVRAWARHYQDAAQESVQRQLHAQESARRQAATAAVNTTENTENTEARRVVNP